MVPQRIQAFKIQIKQFDYNTVEVQLWLQQQP